MAQASFPTATGNDSGGSNTRTFQLEAEHELRFEIPADIQAATLSLETGSAELFGIELAQNRAYPLPPLFNAAVFTWHGATVILTGDDSIMAYTATNTPMPTYINAHAVLQSKRVSARSGGTPGPRAMIVGPKDSGKTALVNILAAYCMKANGRAIVVDVDPSASGVAAVVPGSISLSVVTQLDLDVGGLIHDKVMSFMVGHTSPQHNRVVSEAAFDAIGSLLENVLSTQTMEPFVGCIIDTCGDIDGKDGTETIIHAAKSLKADVVFVLGSERLFASVQSTFDNSTTKAVLVNKSGGVVTRDQSTRLALQANKVREYFYGSDNMYNPFSSVVDFEQVTVLKVGGVAPQLPDSVLPVGAEPSLDPLKPIAMTSLNDLLHKILGVSQAETQEQVVSSPLYGFVHVARVNTERNTLTVLAPSPGKIPSRFLVAGDMKWIE